MIGFAADVVLIIHFLFIVFVVMGGFLALRWRWCAWFHLPAALWGALVEIFGLPCPLTPLEKWMRGVAQQEVYRGGFIQHYIYPILYPDDLTRSDQLVLGLGVIVINVMVYGFVLYRSRLRL